MLISVLVLLGSSFGDDFEFLLQRVFIVTVMKCSTDISRSLDLLKNPKLNSVYKICLYVDSLTCLIFC